MRKIIYNTFLFFCVLLAFQASPARAELYVDVTFYQGWNLSNFPLDVDISGFTLLDIVNELDYVSVWTWKNNTWQVLFKNPVLQQYAEKLGFSAIDSLSPGQPFWIYMKNTEAYMFSAAESSAGSELTFKTGWNLVGLREIQTKPIKDIVPANATSAWKWVKTGPDRGKWAIWLLDNATLQEYAAAKGFEVLENVGPYDGVWVNVGAESSEGSSGGSDSEKIIVQGESVTFEYDLPQGQCSVDFRDGTKQTLSSCSGSIEHTFVKPYVYDVRFYSDDQLVKTEVVTVTNPDEQWVGFVSSLNNYLEENENTEDIIKDGRIYLAPSLSSNSYYWVNYRNINPSIFKSVSGDDFVLEARIKNPYSEGGLSAYDPCIRVLGNTGKVAWVTFMDGSWAVGYTNVGAGDTARKNLYELVRDFSDWREVRLEVKNQTLTVYYEGDIAYTMDYEGSVGQIYGLAFSFKGSGSVDWVKLYNATGQLVYEEDFNGTSDQNNDQPVNLDLLTDFNMIDMIATDDGVMYLVGYKVYDEANTWQRPDGRVYTDQGLYLYKVTKDGVVQQTMLDHFITEDNSNIGLYVDDKQIKVFATKSDQYAYAMTGYIYTLDHDFKVEDKITLFTNANWGWHPKFLDADTLSHFSFAGYYRMVNTDYIEYVQPDVMRDEYNEARLAHSKNLLLLDGTRVKTDETIENIADYFGWSISD